MLASVDLNSPAQFIRTGPGQVRTAAAADLTRPVVPAPNGYRRIISLLNSGDIYYDGLQTNLNKRFGNRFSLLFSYTYSHTINTAEPDVPSGQDANDPNFRGIFERASSLLDQRHRVVMSGWCQLPWEINVGGVGTLASGRPFNVTTGTDNNGDAGNSDRPVFNGLVLGRNTGRGTPVYDLDTFVEKEFKISGDRVRASVRGEAFNLFNHSNIVGRSGVLGNSAVPLATFGTALGGITNVEPGREFQFLVRLRF